MERRCLHSSIDDKGKCERYIRTVRQRFLPTLGEAGLGSLDALNRRLAAWVEGEYHHTPHRGLDGMTPADAWAAKALDVRLADGGAGPGGLFPGEAVRRVSKDRAARQERRLCGADAGLAGRKVTLRFDPSAPPSRPILVAADGQHVGQAWPLDPGANSKVRRGAAISFAGVRAGDGEG